MTEITERALVLFLSAVLAGGFVIAFPKLLKPHLRMLLAFSGAFLLGITVLHILPEAYDFGGARIGMFVMAGFILQIILEYFSGGIEHGHIHSGKSSHDHSKAISWTMLFSLCIHALTESMPLGFHHHEHTHIGHSHEGYLYAIVIHKIPITIALVGLMVGLNLPKTKVIFSLLIFALSAPAGLFISELIGENGNNTEIFAPIMALAGGVILHVSTTILLESSENHRFNLYKITIILIGFLLALAVS